jgi:hypothetical protein
MISIALSVAALALASGVVELANPEIDELSGLAVSRADAGVWWGNNDTGGGPFLYRIGPSGEDLGAVRIDGARAADWEDLAAFDHDGAPALLIADTGDNLGLRGGLVLYAVSDPGRTGRPALLWTLPLRFPDGPRDCEALAVDPVGREILLVSKRDDPPRLYRLALPERTPAATQVAERIGEVPQLAAPPWPERLLRRYAHAPTAFDISRDGATAVLATTQRAYVWRRAPGTGWAQVFAAPPAATLELPSRWQVEAAALSADGRELIVGSEGRPGRIARIALPQ